MVDEEMSGARSANCQHCGMKMRLQRIKKYPGAWPYVIGGLGLFLTFFMVGSFLGIPMILVGVYMSQSSQTIRLCPECGYYYEVYLYKKK